MKCVFFVFTALFLISACGQSAQEQHRISRQERLRLASEDSAALKVAVMPTLDCLPLYVAGKYNLFGLLGVDVRLKHYTAQMDCDTALQRGRVEGAVTDIVRSQRMIKQGMRLTYVASTNAYWQLITNRNARISNLKHLDNKMVSMTRYSVTDLLADKAVAMSGLKPERVFRVQVNDVGVRLRMLLNNSMDALILTEPQATAARMANNRVLLDTRKLDICLGTMVFKSDLLKNKDRKHQIDMFIKAYNMACDSINKNGVAVYRALIIEKCGIDDAVVDSIPRDLKFKHASVPRKKDIELADNWLMKVS